MTDTAARVAERLGVRLPKDIDIFDDEDSPSPWEYEKLWDALIAAEGKLERLKELAEPEENRGGGNPMADKMEERAREFIGRCVDTTKAIVWRDWIARYSADFARSELRRAVEIARAYPVPESIPTDREIGWEDAKSYIADAIEAEFGLKGKS